VTAERLLAVGEPTGDFAGVLQTIADRHAQAFVLFIERATRLLEPILLLAVALVVGGLVVMMYLPIFDIAGGLGVSR
jgi:general secretion pathway protein F